MFRIVDQEIEDEKRQKRGLAPKTIEEKRFKIRLKELVNNEEAKGQGQLDQNRQNDERHQQNDEEAADEAQQD